MSLIWSFFTTLLLVGGSSCSPSVKPDWRTDPAVNNLRSYLRIRTEHPHVNYDEAISYLKGQAKELDLPFKIYMSTGNPILVMTWEGTQATLPSVLLNSHMDVVPVFEKSWIHPPFDAFMDEEGLIYARGAQDMKSVGIQYIEAVRRLRAAGVRPKRTVHLSFMPNEEIGGKQGMKEFVHTEEYKGLNIGFALDEGLASPDQNYVIYNAERSIWRKNYFDTNIDIKELYSFVCRAVIITATGKSGHGSLLHDNTAGEKLRYIIDKFMDLRAVNKRKLTSDPSLTVGDVTTINLTKLSGGVQSNVVPDKLTAIFDIRLALSVDHKEFEDMIRGWCKEAGDGVTLEFEQKTPYVPPTILDETNPYWVAFKTAIDQLNLPVRQRVFPGGTDSRYIRALGTPAIGFSPMANTPVLLHEHNESINATTFLRGIAIYEKIIPAVANV